MAAQRAKELRQEGPALHGVERAIRNAEREELRILSPDGRVLLELTGDQAQIPLNDVALSLFRGNIVTHNHPAGDSFSRSDVRLLLTHKAAQVRVVTPEWTYILDLPLDTEWEDIADLVNIIMGQVRAEHQEAVIRGIMTLDQSDKRFWHDVWSGVAEVRGWRYKRNAAE